MDRRIILIDLTADPNTVLRDELLAHLPDPDEAESLAQLAAEQGVSIAARRLA